MQCAQRIEGIAMAAMPVHMYIIRAKRKLIRRSPFVYSART